MQSACGPQSKPSGADATRQGGDPARSYPRTRSAREATRNDLSDAAPVIPVARAGFALRTAGFFAGNPNTDVSPSNPLAAYREAGRSV